jgi:hypothetical protein
MMNILLQRKNGIHRMKGCLNEQKSLEIKCKDLVQAKIMLDSSIKELEN